MSDFTYAMWILIDSHLTKLYFSRAFLIDICKESTPLIRVV